MEKFDWSRINHLQLGKYAEYFAKMQFVLHGYDVYSSEVDDQGIDFVIRKNHDCYYDIQVKSVRGFGYIFFTKDKFSPRNNLFAVIAVFFNGALPQLYLIPSTAWPSENKVLVSRDYEGKKSKPEWGIQISKKGLEYLEQYAFDQRVMQL